MSKHMRVPDWVYEQAKELAERREVSQKAALGMMVREGGYDAPE